MSKTMQKLTEQILQQDLTALAERDAEVAAGLALVGIPAPRTWPHGFATLLHIIIGQQLSTEVAASIRNRLSNLMPDTTPENFLALEEETLRGIGLSRRKVEYGRGVAEAILSGALNMEELVEMPEEEVVSHLCALRGLGRWSAEIYALFALGRRDIFPAGDLAIREALKRLKKLEARPTEGKARTLTEHWSPYRSATSLFLWKYYRGAPA